MTDRDLKRNNLMRPLEKLQVPLAFVLFYLTYFVLGKYVYQIPSLRDFGTTFPVILMQLTFLISSLFSILILPKSFRQFGFTVARFSLPRVALSIFVLQLPPNIILAFAVANGSPLFQSSGSYWIIILTYLICSPLAEEIFYRGLVQTLLEPLSGYQIRIFKFALSAPVIISALLFSVIHAYAYSYLKSFEIQSIIMNFTMITLLGLICGYLREKHGSLLPAICAHALYNLLGGVLFKIVVDLVN